MKAKEFKLQIRGHLSHVEDLINSMQHKGDTSDDSQKVLLMTALNQLQNVVNGIEQSDLKEEPTEENTQELYSKLDNYFSQSSDNPEVWEQLFTTDEICGFRDDHERVGILYYGDDSIDSDLAQSLRDGLESGEEQTLELEEAHETLKYWVDLIEQRFWENNVTLETV